MFKNVAGQSATLYAVDASTGLPKTGDAANMVFYVSKDDGAVAAIASNSGVPTEIDATNAKGLYKIALSQAESNADKELFSGKSSTANIVIVPAVIYTLPANFTALAVTAGGIAQADVQTIKTQTVTCAASVTVGAFVGNATAALAVDASGRIDVGKLLGTAWLTPGTAGTPDVNAKLLGGTAQTGRDLGASVLLSSGTGTGQLDFTSGVVKANIVQSLGAGIFNSDFTLASATSSTVTLPTTYTAGASLPDDQRYIDTSLQVVAGTGTGQMLRLTTAAGGARQYNVDVVTMPVTCDSTTQCVLTDSGRVDVTRLLGTAWLTPATAGQPDVNIVAVNNDSGAANALGGLSKSAKIGIVAGTPTTTTFDTNLTVNLNVYNGGVVQFYSGNLLGVARKVTGYSYGGGIVTLTVAPALPVAPAANDSFVLFGLAGTDGAPPTAAQIATAVLTDTAAGDVSVSGSLGKIIVTQLGGAFTTTSSSVFTVAALANAPSGTGASAASIATAVWQDLVSSGDMTVSGSIGNLLKTDIDATISSRSTFAGGAVASVTAGVTLAANQHVIVDSGTVTTLSNLPAAPADWLSAAAVSAAAVTKIQVGLSTYAGGDTSGTTTLLARIGSAITISGGKVAATLGATDYSGNTVQTGDSFARIGAAGVGLTNIQLPATGLNLVMVAGKTLPNAIKYIGAGVAGKVSGAGTGTETFDDFSGATAFVVTVDTSGNRTAVAYS